MGNQPSSEAYQGSPLHPPPPDNRPLPPLPLSLPAVPPPPPPPASLPASSTLHTQASSSTHKLSKPRTRPRSTAGLFKSSDGLTKASNPGRFSTSGIGQLVSASFSSPKTPATPTFPGPSTSRPLPPLPLSPKAAAAASSVSRSPSVFTFEEAVASVTGQRDPAAWRPISTVYPTPSLDLELLQEQQARQLEFQQRRQRSQLQYQQLQQDPKQRKQKQKSKTPKPQRQHEWAREVQIRRHRSFGSNLYSQADSDAEQLELSPPERQPREPRRLTKKLSKQKSFFRSKSSQRSDEDDVHFDGKRRNSSGSVYSYSGDRHTWDFGSMTYDQVLNQYYGGPLSENWPPQAGSRTSWNYDMTSYAAKRLLHMVDDTPLDSRLEQASVTSDSKQSVLSEVTWKSSHPVRPESPTLTRANSDLSLYAPIRRTSMIQVPGVATRRNSNSSHISAGGVSMRPTFRHSHPATTPSLSRKSSFESTGSRVQSMPPPVLQRPDLSAYRVSDAKERVSTPCEGDYNAIGAFKLGSLRITNGAASPMSSPARTRKVDTDKDEPAHSSDSNATARTEALAALSGTSSSIDKDNDVPPTPRSYTAHEPEVLTSHHRQLSSSPFASPPNTIPATQPLAVKSLTAPAQEKRSSPATLPKIELPEDLFAGFEFNAFSFEEASSLETSSTAGALQTTSKTTAVEDRLFEEDEVSTSGYAFGSAEVLDVRLDPSAKRSQRRKMASILVSRKSAHSMQSVSRSDSGFVSSPTSETSRKPLSKADSGYSSNVSLRSFKHAASKLMAPVAKAANRLSSDRDSNARLPERESFLIDELKLPSPTFDTPDAEMHALSTNIPQELRRKPLPSIDLPPPISALEAPQRPPPPPPPPSRGAPGLAPENYSLPLSPVSVTTTDVSTPAASEFSLPNKAIGLPDQEKGGSIVPETPNVALRPVSHSAIGSSREAIPNPLTPISIKSSGSASAVKAGGGAKQPKRLLQVLNNGNNTGDDNSGSKDSTSVDVPHIEDHAREAAAALNQHAGLLPGAKRLVAKAHLSKDALKHIFSIGNADVHDYEEVRVDNAVAEPASHDDSIHQDPVHNPTRRHTYQAVSSSLVSVAAAAVTPLRVVTTRRSRVSMSIDFPVDNNVGSDVAAGRERYSSQMDSAVPRRAESKTRKAKLPWLRRRRDGDRRTPSPENSLDDDGDIFASGPRSHGSSRMFDDSAIGMEDDSRMPSRASSTIISRTMSLTAQLERTLSMKLLFPRLSRPSTSDDNSTRPRAPDEQHPSPSLPSPLFAEAMAMQRRAMTPEGAVTPSPPVSIRMQQIRPSMLRVPPPLRSRSTPPGEAGMRSASRPVSQDSLFSASSRPYIDYDDTDFIASVLVSSPPPITSPSRQVDAKWEVHTDHGISAISSLPSQRQRNSCEGQSRGNSIDYASAHDKRGSMHQSRSNSMVTSRGQYAGTASQDGYGLQRSLSRMDPHIASMDGGGDGGQAEDVRLLRHRASYDGYSNGPRQTWDAGSYGPPQYNPPRMSNGYTGPVPAVGPYGSGRRRSGSGSSSHGDIYQLQQQQAWDFYYQQYTRPPPSFPRGAHQRNRSMGSRFGPVPGPQAPYRILHSYNSPAYRGVPIWG